MKVPVTITADVEVTPAELARMLAEAGDAEQAEFFNALFPELLIVCRTPGRKQDQMCYLAVRLNSLTIDHLQELIDYWEAEHA